ncbi:hypothetical protein [Leuconostoc falkenbergense]|uniref:hypothetical protein n=1 Tax=Leuconostoc falkenbergense TaxID=2766470 RepID=UPI00293C2ABA|nr:hypothetical protein [Leuconostoc falkenbergense]MDV3544872.1 hypothetical protein [Leuconostoc falkenbergense]
MFLGLDVGSWADWVSGIGSLGAILMVLFQIKKNKESDFSQSRPMFKINYEVEAIKRKKDKVYYDRPSDNNGQMYRGDFNYQCIELKNISRKSMLAVQVSLYVTEINYDAKAPKVKRKINFKVDSVKPDENVNFILKNLSKTIGIQQVPIYEYYDFDEVIIYFTTEMREKIKIIYQKEGKYLYYKKSFLENKGAKIPNEEYTANNFKESRILET